jgi:hypothetical protein
MAIENGTRTQEFFVKNVGEDESYATKDGFGSGPTTFTRREDAQEFADDLNEVTFPGKYAVVVFNDGEIQQALDTIAAEVLNLFNAGLDVDQIQSRLEVMVDTFSDAVAVAGKKQAVAGK